MKASEITEGRRYLMAVTIPGAGPRLRATRAASVIARHGAKVVVEVREQTCVNRHEIPDGEFTRAMLDGELRYELRPVRRSVRAADILGPISPERGAGDEPAGELEDRPTVGAA